jgi:sterol desaturase/sphingolipid hydroxylase (fatty acid hydroxylase superfamily)
LAAYAPVVLVAVAIVALEPWVPERLEWRPRRSDVKADAAFMAIVQVALPRALALITALTISAWMHEHAPSTWWPHAWPLAAQIVAMVLIVDLLRYWLHRACHSHHLLWRLHEVHHSPDILYSLNVGRFHPIEKALHFSLDTVPFLLLGVEPAVVSGYFLLYSVNGFFQHSNLRLRYGWLNYVVGSAETHRWHHARDPKAAACNFGNTTIVWDLLFGTWYLPKDQLLHDVGVMDRGYPRGFCAQMTAPFRRRDRRPRRTLQAWLGDAQVRLRLRWTRFTYGQRIVWATRDPMRAQRRVLAKILRQNRATTFGRRYGFDAIHDYAGFAQRVPVSEYEALRPLVDAEIERGENALTAQEPARYARTSGTTGRPKDIPLTSSHLEALQRIHALAVAFQYRACPSAFEGGILDVVSPAYEGVLANGKPFGSASGLVAGNTPGRVLDKFVVPSPVLTITDSRVKYLLILRLAIARPDVTYLGAANPATLLTLIKLFRQHQSELTKDLREGAFFLSDKVPVSVLAAIGPCLHASVGRANELAQLQAGANPPRLADLFPELRAVVTWTCGSAGMATDALRRELASRTRILELGYVASEFRGTVSFGLRAGSGLPTLDTHFFEFVEREKWDRAEPEFLTLEQIRKGFDYYIIVTTPSGLYRYFINDLVRVRGFLHKTPLLEFRQKGKGVTDITGEKLYETQLLMAVREALAGMGQAARFVMMLADEEMRSYRLYVEPEAGARPSAVKLANAVDARLGQLNVEYRAKRESDRLGMLKARWLAAGTAEAYRQHCVTQGQREGQFKVVALGYRKNFTFDLDGHAECD